MRSLNLSAVIVWIVAHKRLLLLAVVLWRLLYLWLSPFDLIGDEAYYWEWSRRPDWCYYSKPPMVAWLIGVSTWLFGDFTEAVRLPAVLLGGVFLFYYERTARAFYGEHAAAMALLLLLATPINTIASFLMTIDAPLYCCWIACVYYLRRALFDGHKQAWWWAGLAAALGVLSKQAALLLPALLAVFLALDNERRAYLKREFLYFLIPMLLALVPIVWWNAQHDWVTFDHSKGHFSGQSAPTWSKHLQHTAEFWLYQLLLISPVTAILAVWLSVREGINWRQLEAEKKFLWCMGPLMLLAMIVLSALQKTQGNWSMAFYLAALISLAGDWRNGRWQRVLPIASAIGLSLVLLTYSLTSALNVLNLQHTRWDPTKRFNHWQALADTIQSQRVSLKTDLRAQFWIALGHRYLASELAFYLPDHPEFFRFELPGHVISQYEVWPGPERFLGQNAFLISEQAQLPEAVSQAFAQTELMAEITDPLDSSHHYYLFAGHQLLKSWR